MPRADRKNLETGFFHIMVQGIKKEEIFYKVCVGAYKDKNNAIKQLEMAKNKGFHDSYII